MWNLMTLDGFVEGLNRDISWHFDVWGEELEQLSIVQLNAAGGLLFGRVTYELMAKHWPGATGEVADFMNAPDRRIPHRREPDRSGRRNPAIQAGRRDQTQTARFKGVVGRDRHPALRAAELRGDRRCR
jgi:dihydrofolate reductase